MFCNFCFTLKVLTVVLYLTSNEIQAYNWTKAEPEVITTLTGPICKSGTDARCTEDGIKTFIPGSQQTLDQVECAVNILNDPKLPQEYCSISGATHDAFTTGGNKQDLIEFVCYIYDSKDQAGKVVLRCVKDE